MNNIDKFDILVGKVLAKLYGEFPKRLHIQSHDFGVKNPVEEFLGSENAEDIEQSGLSESEFFDNTMKFLIDEGVIIAKQNATGSFYGVRLTSKGLKILKRIPNSINEKASNVGDWLKSSAKVLNEEMLKKVASLALGML